MYAGTPPFDGFIVGVPDHPLHLAILPAQPSGAALLLASNAGPSSSMPTAAGGSARLIAPSSSPSTVSTIPPRAGTGNAIAIHPLINDQPSTFRAGLSAATHALPLDPALVDPPVYGSEGPPQWRTIRTDVTLAKVLELLRTQLARAVPVPSPAPIMGNSATVEGEKEVDADGRSGSTLGAEEERAGQRATRAATAGAEDARINEDSAHARTLSHRGKGKLPANAGGEIGAKQRASAGPVSADGSQYQHRPRSQIHQGPSNIHHHRQQYHSYDDSIPTTHRTHRLPQSHFHRRHRQQYHHPHRRHPEGGGGGGPSTSTTHVRSARDRVAIARSALPLLGGSAWGREWGAGGGIRATSASSGSGSGSGSGSEFSEEEDDGMEDYSMYSDEEDDDDHQAGIGSRDGYGGERLMGGGREEEEEHDLDGGMRRDERRALRTDRSRGHHHALHAPPPRTTHGKLRSRTHMSTASGSAHASSSSWNRHHHHHHHHDAEMGRYGEEESEGEEAEYEDEDMLSSCEHGDEGGKRCAQVQEGCGASAAGLHGEQQGGSRATGHTAPGASSSPDSADLSPSTQTTSTTDAAASAAAHADLAHFQTALLDVLECQLCYLLLYEPITTPCGHTFCRACFARNLDHSDRCPLCRARMPSWGFWQEHATSKCLMDLILLEVDRSTPTSEGGGAGGLAVDELSVGGATLEEMEEEDYDDDGAQAASVKNVGRARDWRRRHGTAEEDGDEDDNEEEEDDELAYRTSRPRAAGRKKRSAGVRRWKEQHAPTTSSVVSARQDLVAANAQVSVQHSPTSLRSQLPSGNSCSTTVPINPTASLGPLHDNQSGAVVRWELPSLYTERRLAAELDEASARLSTPIFVCTLAYPDMPTVLHIYEPRYRLMVRRCLESGNPRFGMVMPARTSSPNAPGMYEYGTMLEIRSVQMLPDGRSMIETVGSYRFRVHETGTLDGYSVGRVERIEDAGPEEEMEMERVFVELANGAARAAGAREPPTPAPASAGPGSGSAEAQGGQAATSYPATDRAGYVLGLDVGVADALARQQRASLAAAQQQQQQGPAAMLRSNSSSMGSMVGGGAPASGLAASVTNAGTGVTNTGTAAAAAVDGENGNGSTMTPMLVALHPSIDELVDVCVSFIETLRSGSAPLLLTRLNQSYGPMPARDEIGRLAYWMALVIPIDEHEKARLLSIRSARLRLRLVVHWIEQLRSSWWFASGCTVC